MQGGGLWAMDQPMLMLMGAGTTEARAQHVLESRGSRHPQRREPLAHRRRGSAASSLNGAQPQAKRVDRMCAASTCESVCDAAVTGATVLAVDGGGGASVVGAGGRFGSAGLRG